MGRRRRKARQNNGQQYNELYTSKQLEKDQKVFDDSLLKGRPDWTSFRRLVFKDLCLNTNIIDTGCIGEIKIKDIQTAIHNPRAYWRTLLAVSEYLMQASPYYYKLNSFYNNSALFCWSLDLYDVKQSANTETIKKNYFSLAAKLESMNIKHEYAKIMRVLPYQDIYCGLLLENNTDFFIQQVNYKICKLYSVQDGIYNFAINLSMIKPTSLNAYPDYVQKAYLDFKDDKIGMWYIPPSDKQICIKLNYQWTYPFPMLIGLIKDILDLDVYKKLKLQSARTDNYKAILIKVPIDESMVDKPLITPDTLSIFAEINKQNMTDDIGLIHTLGSSGQAISFKDSSNTRNNVSDAVDEIYNSSGVTKELFNGSSSATAVTYSIENDSGVLYDLYRQFERWTNRFIKLRKYNKSNYKFYFSLLDITIYNRDNVTSRYKDLATLGITCIDKLLASVGMTPSRVKGSYIVHKDIFDFQNNLVPLSSTYNSSSSEVGRPTNASKGELLDTSGEQTADSDANNDR